MRKLRDAKEGRGESEQAQLEALALAHEMVPRLEVLPALARRDEV